MHRHLMKLLRLSECWLDENGDLQPREFEYCPICKRVPTTFTGEDDVKEAKDEGG